MKMQTFQTLYLTIKSKFKRICIFCHIILLRMFNIIHLLKSPSLDVAVKKVESWRTVMALEVNLNIQSLVGLFYLLHILAENAGDKVRNR